MITPESIKIKASKRYVTYLQSYVEGKLFERLVIPADKSYSKTSLPEFEREILSIISHSKEKKGYGYSLKFQNVRTKYLGVQDLPIEIFFESEKDFLRYIGKEKEADYFKRNCKKIFSAFPELFSWVSKYPARIIEKQDYWDGILKVISYFNGNPEPNLYIRELPIKVHTKFVETHKSVISELLDIVIAPSVKTHESQFEKRYNLKYLQPQVRFRILDKKLSQNYFQGIDDLEIPLSEFENLALPIKTVLVVENKTTLYTTLTLPLLKNAIAIFGRGYRVCNLANVKWFKETELLYWGDMDVHGFEILSQFRGYFPHTESVLMDKVTFGRFFENDSGTLSNVTTLLYLTEGEKELYNLLKDNNWRLEQEKIPVDYVNNYFQSKKVSVI